MATHNKHNDIISQALLIVVILYSNCFYLHKCHVMKKYFKESSTAVIQCPYKSTGFPLVWMKGKQLALISTNNQLVSNYQQHKIEIIGKHSDGEYNLVIHNFSTNDQGLYRCQGITKQTAFAADIMAVMSIPPSHIKIANKTKMNTVELFEGRKSELACMVKNGIPRARIVLNIDGKDAKNGSNDFISFQLEGTKGLHMKPIKCTADHSFLEKPLEDAAVLFVFMSPSLRIAADPSKQILDGNRIILECIDSSNVPARNYSWKHDGSILPNVTSNLLKIDDVTKTDSGIYACHVQNRIGSSSSNITVNVYHRPYLFRNYTLKLNYKTEVGGRVMVLIPVESNPEPLTVSFLNITDLKLDTWIIEKDVVGRNVFFLSTTLFPLHTEQYDRYLILVRNQYGSLKVKINLKLPDANVTILPVYPLCDVAENLTLSCTLHHKNFRQWTNSWTHWINKTFIRNVSSIIKGNTSFVYFPFCDYQDFGTYKCSWVLQNRHGISSVFVLVNSKPVKTDYRMSISNTDILLSVYIFSKEPILSIDWYEHGLIISNTSELYESFIRMTDIQLSVYKKRLTISGFEVGLRIRQTNFSEHAIYICQITNVYGSTDMYFEADQFPQITIEYEELTTLTDMSTRLEESTNGSIYKIVVKNIHFVISGLVFICAVLIGAMFCWIRKGRRKFTLRKQNKSHTTAQQRKSQEEMNDSEYAEIENDYYHSVEWRVYPAGVVNSPLRCRSGHPSASSRSSNALDDPTNVYLEVIADAKSLKDEQTTMLHDSASACDESSSGKTSGTSSSSYVQPIMRNSLSDSNELTLAHKKDDEAGKNYNNSSENTNSEDNNSGFSRNLSYLNVNATLSAEEIEFEGNMSIVNKELCEKTQMEANLNYEQLNIVQTETHLYAP